MVQRISRDVNGFTATKSVAVQSAMLDKGCEHGQNVITARSVPVSPFSF